MIKAVDDSHYRSLQFEFSEETRFMKKIIRDENEEDDLKQENLFNRLWLSEVFVCYFAFVPLLLVDSFVFNQKSPKTLNSEMHDLGLKIHLVLILICTVCYGFSLKRNSGCISLPNTTCFQDIN